MVEPKWLTAFGRSNYELHLVDMETSKDSLCGKITGFNLTWIRPIASNRLKKTQWKKCDDCKQIELENKDG